MATSEIEIRKSFSIAREMDKSHLLVSRRTIYTALEDLEFNWDAKDVRTFDLWWRNGVPLLDIARAFQRDCDEVAVLCMDRARQGRVEARERGIWGREA